MPTRDLASILEEYASNAFLYRPATITHDRFIAV
jgi:hypothetical protein